MHVIIMILCIDCTEYRAYRNTEPRAQSALREHRSTERTAVQSTPQYRTHCSTECTTVQSTPHYRVHHSTERTAIQSTPQYREQSIMHTPGFPWDLRCDLGIIQKMQIHPGI